MFTIVSRRTVLTVLLLCSIFAIQAYASKGEAVGAPMSSEEIEEALQVARYAHMPVIDFELT